MENQKTVYINFYDGIDLVKVNKFIQFTTDVISKYNPTELYYFISSKGGDVDAGFTLYNFLISLQSKLTVTMHNIGTIDSIANIIFIAGGKRYAAPNAAFLFHGYTLSFNAPVGKALIDTFVNRTKLTAEEINTLFNQGESKDVKFALQKGIIDDINPPSVPRGELRLAMSFV